MNPGEYHNLLAIEQEHWFYRGKRRIVRYWLEQFLELKPDDLLIDAGMGTGAWALEMAGRCRVLGIDDHAESLALATPRLAAAGARVLQAHLGAVPLNTGAAAAITLLDVLEHLDDDRGAWAEMVRLTRPGGLLIITVPALPWLWSDWDEALHHRRRYTRRSLLGVLQHPEVQLLRCTYFNTAVLPAVALVRRSRRLGLGPPGAARLEDRIPRRLVNQALFHLLVRPACWAWFSSPIGVSLLAVLRRV